MARLLGALLKNESGGRNIANTHEGTSSGQAQGYFQITTGTWDDFGGRKYGPTPMHASYEQQADIASKIPLKRWDSSTLAAMRATGLPIDPNRTLGENLAMHGEDFGGGARDGGQGQAPAPMVMDGQKGGESLQPAGYSTRPQGPVEAAGGGYGSDPVNPAMQGPISGRGGLAAIMAGQGGGSAPAPAPASGPAAWLHKLGQSFGGMDNPFGGADNSPPRGAAMPQPGPARIDQGDVPTIDAQQQDTQRQMLAQALLRLNSGKLYG